jgi:hypothetical protein
VDLSGSSLEKVDFFPFARRKYVPICMIILEKCLLLFAKGEK